MNGMDARKLELAGKVEIDAYEHITEIGPAIGGRQVVSAIEAVWGWDQPRVRVTLGVEPIATGVLNAAPGFGGTDVTPPELPEITIGDVDLIDRLRELDGREVVLIVEDAPA